MSKYAVRNLRLCTKDCLCLFVCPVGATDTENSVIDVEKCIGCGACAEVCPSKAISMVPKEYPTQQPKEDAVVGLMKEMVESKATQEAFTRNIQETTDKDGLYRLMKGFEKSLRLLGADGMRESRYMLPQSNETKEFLQKLIDTPPSEDFPLEEAKKLLEAMSK